MKKIVWTINLPLACFSETLSANPMKGQSGTWLQTLFHEMTARIPAEYHLISKLPESRAPKVIRKEIAGHIHYLISERKRAIQTHFHHEVQELAGIISDVKPDLIHHHGTEFWFGLVAPRFPQIPQLVEIQGIRNYLCAHQYRDISRAKYYWRSFRRNPLRFYNNFRAEDRRLIFERQIFAANRIFLGRTEFDRAYAQYLHPGAEYHGELHRIIRPEFYASSWDIARTNPVHLVSVIGQNTVKGVIFLTNTAAVLAREFPNLTWTVIGSLNSLLKPSIDERIKAGGLGGKLRFVGSLDASGIISQFASARCFVHTSFAENSPNTLQEAQAFGMPCVAAFTGGIPSLVDDGRDALLYPPGDIAYLSAQIRKVIGNDDLAVSLGHEANHTATVRNNPETVVGRYEAIYRKYLGAE
jgi:L-malate glycosyltransferase